MTDEKKDQENKDLSLSDRSRREFVGKIRKRGKLKNSLFFSLRLSGE